MYKRRRLLDPFDCLYKSIDDCRVLDISINGCFTNHDVLKNHFTKKICHELISQDRVLKSFQIKRLEMINHPKFMMPGLGNSSRFIHLDTRFEISYQYVYIDVPKIGDCLYNLTVDMFKFNVDHYYLSINCIDYSIHFKVDTPTVSLKTINVITESRCITCECTSINCIDDSSAQPQEDIDIDMIDEWDD